MKTTTTAVPSVEIRSCTEADYDGVFALYGEVFGDQALKLFRRRWRWQFFENPVNRRVASHLWVADLDGAVVGFLASFPTRMKFGDLETIIYHDCDLIVSSRTRRLGIGERLVRAYDEFPNPLSNALAYAPANGRIRGRVGYQPLHAVPFYYRPIRPSAVLRYVQRSPRIPRAFARAPLAWMRPLVGPLMDGAAAALNRTRAPRIPSGWTAHMVEHAGPEFDALWLELKDRFPLIAVRDASFVQWRFLDDPVFDHRVMMARNPTGQVAGYVALRLVDRRGMRVGRIMDLFGDPNTPEMVDTLVAAAVDQFAAHDAAIISCLGLHPSLRRRVQRYLYFRPRGLDRPAWMLWKGDDALQDLVYDERQWHLSHGDSDIGFSP